MHRRLILATLAAAALAGCGTKPGMGWETVIADGQGLAGLDKVGNANWRSVPVPGGAGTARVVWGVPAPGSMAPRSWQPPASRSTTVWRGACRTVPARAGFSPGAPRW